LDGPKFIGATLKNVRLAVDDRVTLEDLYEAGRRHPVVSHACGMIGPILVD
jgi:hypothetical protein